MPRPPAPKAKPVTASSGGPSGVLIGGVVVLVVALIAGLVWAATRGSGDLSAAGSGNTLPEGGGVSLGAGGEDVPEVHVYGDFQCPWCGVLENSIGPAMEELLEDEQIQLRVTLMSFLDGNNPGESSLRAANAALCADDAGVFLPYYQELYANQPQGGGGWTDDQLNSYAQAIGLSGEELDTFGSCVADRPHEDYVHAMQERANRDGVTGTPRLFVDGTQISDEEMQRLMDDGSQLEAVIEANS